VFASAKLLAPSFATCASANRDELTNNPASGLARIRRGRVSATIYAGTDASLGIASGLANNPTFLNFRTGRAVLQSVRMGGQFFSLAARGATAAFSAASMWADRARFTTAQAVTRN
jgi:hypothetical protein